MDTFRFFKALTLVFCIAFQVANAQIQGCSLLGIDIQECLDQAANSGSLETCCRILNQAFQAGYYCLCLLLRSATPLLEISLALQLSDCHVSGPPLTQCQRSLPVFHSPDSHGGLPALDHPPPPPAWPMPVEMPPEQPLQPSTPNDFVVPLTPGRNEIPPNSTSTKNPSSNVDFHYEFAIPKVGDMKSGGGNRFKVELHAGLFFYLLPHIL